MRHTSNLSVVCVYNDRPRCSGLVSMQLVITNYESPRKLIPDIHKKYVWVIWTLYFISQSFSKVTANVTIIKMIGLFVNNMRHP